MCDGQHSLLKVVLSVFDWHFPTDTPPGLWAEPKVNTSSISWNALTFRVAWKQDSPPTPSTHCSVPPHCRFRLSLVPKAAILFLLVVVLRVFTRWMTPQWPLGPKRSRWICGYRNMQVFKRIFRARGKSSMGWLSWNVESCFPWHDRAGLLLCGQEQGNWQGRERLAGHRYVTGIAQQLGADSPHRPQTGDKQQLNRIKNTDDLKHTIGTHLSSQEFWQITLQFSFLWP